MKKHVISFRAAFNGVIYAFCTQPNFKIHFTASVLVIILGIIVNLSWVEWLILIFTIIMVFQAEMINTAIESMTDLITTQHHELAKRAKDIAAGMVLISAIGSILIGLIIFAPKI